MSSDSRIPKATQQPSDVSDLHPINKLIVADLGSVCMVGLLFGSLSTPHLVQTTGANFAEARRAISGAPDLDLRARAFLDLLAHALAALPDNLLVKPAPRPPTQAPACELDLNYLEVKGELAWRASLRRWSQVFAGAQPATVLRAALEAAAVDEQVVDVVAVLRAFVAPDVG